MRTPRVAFAVIAAVLVVAGGAYTVDAVSASRLEAEISARIAPGAPGTAPPSVMTGGPFSRWSDSDTLSSVSIRAEDVERPGLGPVAVEAEATDVRVPGGQDGDGDGDDHGLTARSVVVSVQITGDSLAPALGMRDVLVGAADDPSLAGGTEHRANVSGTLIGSGERVSVIVDLVVDPSAATSPHHAIHRHHCVPGFPKPSPVLTVSFALFPLSPLR